MTLAKGNELVLLIQQIADLEWAKSAFSCPTYSVGNKKITEDRSSEPPYSSFRFKTEDPVLMQKLMESVDSYSGKVKWVMVGHDRITLPGRNWTICPKLTLDVEAQAESMGCTTSQYFKENMPEFGPTAYADMLNLVRYVDDALSQK